MPPVRNWRKSMKATTASSVGRRLSSTAGVRKRARYETTPQRVRLQSAKTSRMSSHARVFGFTNRVSHSRELSGAGFGPKTDVGLKRIHHGAEIGEGEGLRAIADGLFGTGVDFEDRKSVV